MGNEKKNKLKKTKVKEKKQKLVSNVPFIKSMKWKITCMVSVAAIITASMMLLIALPLMRSALREEASNHLYDMAVSNGSTLEAIEKDDRDLKNRVALINQYSELSMKGIDHSYAMLIDKDGTILYHQDEKLMGKQIAIKEIKSLVTDLQMGKRAETQVLSYTDGGKNMLASVYASQLHPALLVICSSESEVMKPVATLTYLCVGVFVVIAIIFIIVALIASGIMVRPVVAVTVLLEKMATMDFSNDERMTVLAQRNDETGLMARSAANLCKELAEVIGQIREQSEALYYASESMNSDTQDTVQFVEKVGGAVGDIASGATSQANETQSATENVITMGNMIELANKEASTLEDNSYLMRDSSNKAMNIMRELMEVNLKTMNSIDAIYNQTNLTYASAQQIQEATEIIAAIAEETDLLSLNASIEAAKAGEQGRGFAVVAGQIQKLAEQSNLSAQEIDKIITELISESTQAVETMQEVQDIMGLQNQKLKETDNMFKQVYQGVEDSLGSVHEITEHTEELDVSRGRVVDVVQNLSAIAQENASNSEVTSASVVSVSETLGKISSNAAKLKDIAFQLDQSVKKITF